MVGDNIIKQSTGTVKKFIVFSYSSVNSVTCNNEQGVEVNFSRINNSLQMPNQSLQNVVKVNQEYQVRFSV